MAALLEPIGFGCEPDGATVVVTVPTNRPDVRPAPYGIDDVIEEVGRTYGYAKLPRRQPSWPQPGALTTYQRERRRVRDVLCGLGASEAWTPSFLADLDHRRIGLSGPAVAVANPLAAEESVLRRSLLPGLLGALAYNADRREASIRLFEIGTVFSHPDEGLGRAVERSGAGGQSGAVLPKERELLAVVLAFDSNDTGGPVSDDARSAVAAWLVLADALRLRNVELVATGAQGVRPGLHPTRSADLVVRSLGSHDGPRIFGSVGEVDPAVVADFGLGSRRVGWLEIELGLLDGVPRSPSESSPLSRFPSSDIDLALVVDDAVTAAEVARTLRAAGGAFLESVTLFDVYRGAAIEPGARSLAYRLRFCAPDHTMTDKEVGQFRQACIEAAVINLGARLR
jgi:phenylalanyl-tRNA synthetase beta chain